MHIPKYIVAYGDTKTAYESITGTVITPKVPNALSVRDVKREIAEEYFNSTNYKEELGNFYRDYIANMANPFEMGKPKRKREPKGGE